MVLEIKPTAEDIEPEVSRPGLFSSEPTRQLCHENLLAHFPQDFADVLLRVTLRDQVDRRLPSQASNPCLRVEKTLLKTQGSNTLPWQIPARSGRIRNPRNPNGRDYYGA